MSVNLQCITIYYIDTSVLLENIPCVKSIRNYIRDPSGVFSISSLVRICWHHFRFCTVVCAISRKTLVSNIIKRKLHGGLKIWILFSSGKNNILLTREALMFVKYCFYHSKIKFISSRRHVISSIYYTLT